MGRWESGLTEVVPLICTSPNWGQYLCFHLLSFLGAHLSEWLQCDGSLRAGTLFLSWVSSGLSSSCWWLWPLCLLIGQDIVRFLNYSISYTLHRSLGYISGSFDRHLLNWHSVSKFLLIATENTIYIKLSSKFIYPLISWYMLGSTNIKTLALGLAF